MRASIVPLQKEYNPAVQVGGKYSARKELFGENGLVGEAGAEAVTLVPELVHLIGFSAVRRVTGCIALFMRFMNA